MRIGELGNPSGWVSLLTDASTFLLLATLEHTLVPCVRLDRAFRLEPRSSGRLASGWLGLWNTAKGSSVCISVHRWAQKLSIVLFEALALVREGLGNGLSMHAKVMLSHLG